MPQQAEPDCLASAITLGRIAAEASIDEGHILYSGDISHQQNRAFVNLIDVDLNQYDRERIQDRAADSLLAIVDHSLPGANNTVPEGAPIDILIDHHPADDIDGQFVDHREEIGAVATIFVLYVRALDIELDSTLATTLLFAIRRETLNFLRGATREEYDAAGYLHGHADPDLLRQFSTPSVSGATLDAIGTTIGNRTTKAATLVPHVGRTTERDAMPPAADYLATQECVETAIVFGIVDDAVHLSARSSDPRTHVGTVLDAAFEDVGSAGGHHDVTGGEISLGVFADSTSDDEWFRAIVEQVITGRICAELDLTDDSEA